MDNLHVMEENVEILLFLSYDKYSASVTWITCMKYLVVWG